VHAGLIDGFLLIHLRLQAEALAPKLRVRSPLRAAADSPFYRLGRAGERIAAAVAGGSAPLAEARAWRDLAACCREESGSILRGLEESGVSVDIVFGLEAIERCLCRLEAILALFEAAPGERRSAAIQRLLAQLAAAAVEERKLSGPLATNLKLLYRRIVDRAGSTGEHYIAVTRREYRALTLAAVGGGLLTVGTAAIKTTVHTWHLAAFPEGLLYSFNYAFSFMLLQHFHLVLATKQPAMTAATLAGILRDRREDERAEEIVDFAARITSSQLAAAAGNVGAVALGCWAFSRVWLFLMGAPWLTPAQANEVLVGPRPSTAVRSSTPPRPGCCCGSPRSPAAGSATGAPTRGCRRRSLRTRAVAAWGANGWCAGAGRSTTTSPVGAPTSPSDCCSASPPRSGASSACPSTYATSP
jgi:site-specific recombinase